MFSVAALCRHSPKASSSVSSDWSEYGIFIQVGSSTLTSTTTGARVYKITFRCGCIPVCVFGFNCRGDLLIDPIDKKYCQKTSVYIVLHHQHGNLISCKIIHSIIILKYWSKLLAIHKRLN